MGSLRSPRQRVAAAQQKQMHDDEPVAKRKTPLIDRIARETGRSGGDPIAPVPATEILRKALLPQSVK